MGKPRSGNHEFHAIPRMQICVVSTKSLAGFTSQLSAFPMVGRGFVRADPRSFPFSHPSQLLAFLWTVAVLLPLSHFPGARGVIQAVVCCRSLARGKAVKGLPYPIAGPPVGTNVRRAAQQMLRSIQARLSFRSLNAQPSTLNWFPSPLDSSRPGQYPISEESDGITGPTGGPGPAIPVHSLVMSSAREEQLFRLVLAQPAGARSAWLDHECADDSELRQRLAARLTAQESADTETRVGSSYRR